MHYVGCKLAEDSGRIVTHGLVGSIVTILMLQDHVADGRDLWRVSIGN
jgi:hypothetical protein